MAGFAIFMSAIRRIEWPTVLLIAVNYAIWFWLALRGEWLHPAAWIALAAISSALY
jgi:hypothetical protein